MSQVEDFLSAEDEQDIIAAIRTAEQKTSGEIRIHIEAHTDLDTFERALEVFHLLKMDNTKLRNGVLIYVAVSDRNFVIYGDESVFSPPNPSPRGAFAGVLLRGYLCGG